MEWLWLVGAVVVVGWLWLNSKAKGIVRRHAETLSERTGIPADRIYREMRDGNVTPGEWAASHGFDPLTFEPREPSEEARAHARREVDRIWRRLRLEPDSEPPDEATLGRIGELHSELAMNMLEPAPTSVELERRSEIAVELYESGSRVDAEWVNATIEQAREEMPDSRYSEESVLGRPQTQEQFDEWQRGRVEGQP